VLLDGGTAREHRQHGEVEAVGVSQRYGREDAISRVQPERGDDVGGLGSDARMRQRDRLRHPGRAGRELHERNAREVGGLCCARGNDERERREHVDAERVHGAARRVRDASALVRRGQDQCGPEAPRYSRELGHSQRRRHEHDGRPDLPRRNDCGDERARRVQGQRHAAALA
jgi:hypothetical protein